MDAERQRDIEQGLRHESGALTFSLVAEEYWQGISDFKVQAPPPKFSTASYDLGRRAAVRDTEERQRVLDAINAEQERRHASMLELLADRPDVLADYTRRMAAISAPPSKQAKPPAQPR